METILITGVAGFIGFHLAKKMLDHGYEVIGIDNLNEYYDVSLKTDRLSQIKEYKNFTFQKLDLCDRLGIEALFQQYQFDRVINLAAQAGVRYSLESPHTYVDTNLVGFLNILEGCRNSKIKHLIFASSSSVYGANSKVPFSTADAVDHPVSLYAATKRANELMAYSYSHLYQIPTTGLRFFTVYGPWGRPDMAPCLFAKAILSNQSINVFNHGDMQRDFTYIDDIVEGLFLTINTEPKSNQDDSVFSSPPYKLYNIGNSKPVKLMDFIEHLETSLGCSAQKNFLPMQMGDVPSTYADIEDLTRDTGFQPSTTISEGIEKFAHWYRSYYQNQ
jgi:UDP-glucuronate 4-epimerase